MFYFIVINLTIFNVLSFGIRSCILKFVVNPGE